MIQLVSEIALKDDLHCFVVTVLSHLFVLATFMWMFIEGIFLYLYVVQVFLVLYLLFYENSDANFKLVLFIFA